jgi:hypothetical protein
LENALPWDTIQPVNYSQLNLVQPYLNLLRQRSDARVTTNQEFVYIRQDIDELQKVPGTKTMPTPRPSPPFIDNPQKPQGDNFDELQVVMGDKTATLNEREALKEREKAAAQNKARDEERAARKAPDEKIYELTVEDCEQPGLPPLPGQTNGVAAAGSTNAVTTVTGKKPPPPNDPILYETENILEDYVALLSQSNVLIANHLRL